MLKVQAASFHTIISVGQQLRAKGNMECFLLIAEMVMLADTLETEYVNSITLREMKITSISEMLNTVNNGVILVMVATKIFVFINIQDRFFRKENSQIILQ